MPHARSTRILSHLSITSRGRPAQQVILSRPSVCAQRPTVFASRRLVVGVHVATSPLAPRAQSIARCACLILNTLFTYASPPLCHHRRAPANRFPQTTTPATPSPATTVVSTTTPMPSGESCAQLTVTTRTNRTSQTRRMRSLHGRRRLISASFADVQVVCATAAPRTRHSTTPHNAQCADTSLAKRFYLTPFRRAVWPSCTHSDIHHAAAFSRSACVDPADAGADSDASVDADDEHNR